ncbi:MAG: hypothetical protein ACOCWA_02760, partial [Bacteroidota bacterium]
MERTAIQKILFIVNPQSGGAKEINPGKMIDRLSGDYNFEFKIYEMKGGEDKRQIEKQIDSYNPD